MEEKMGKQDEVTPDIVYFEYNGVMVVAPTKGGILGVLYEENDFDNQVVWAFADIRYLECEIYGHALVDHHLRGLVCGSLLDGKAYLGTCRQLGLCVRRRPMFVPLSRGPIKVGHSISGHKPILDYSDSDRSQCSQLLRTESQLQGLVVAEAWRRYGVERCLELLLAHSAFFKVAEVYYSPGNPCGWRWVRELMERHPDERKRIFLSAKLDGVESGLDEVESLVDEAQAIVRGTSIE